MADLSGLGDLVLTVGGDITPLTSALDSIPAAAQSAASQIQAAFDALPSATEGVNASLANLSTGLSEAGQQAASAAGSVDQLPPALQETSEAAGEAGSKLKEFVTAGLELAGIALSFEALKEAVTEIVSAFDQLQRATISLTALTGSVEAATATLDQLKTLAVGDALSFPALIQAQQRMTALGIATSQTAPLMQAAANAAAAMGNDFNTVVNVMDRMAVSGTVMARGLAQIGLSTADLAKAMNVTTGEVNATFKAMDQTDRINTIIAAMQKFDGVAAALADSLSGRWQSFKTSVEFALEGVGEAIDTGLTQTVQTAQNSVIPGIQAMTKAFQDLASVFGPLITGAVNSFTQSMGDLLNVVSSGVTALVTLGKSANDTGISFSQLVHYVSDVTPWGLFADSIHQAAVDLNLLHANADMAAASMLVMDQRFASVTDSLKAFIDKTTESHNTLLGIRTDYEALKQAVADAKTTLEVYTDAFNKHMASAGQVQAATKALEAAQLALNGTVSAGSWTIKGYADEMEQLKTALQTAKDHLAIAATAYAEGSASLGQYEKALTAVKTAQDALNGSMAKSPTQQVADEFDKLQAHLQKAQDYLAAVTAALQTGGATMGMYQTAVSAVNTAQQALTGSTQTATAAISSSAPKVIDVTNALNGMAAATSSAAAAHVNFVGPVKATSDAIQIFTGNTSSAADASKTLEAGVEVLRGSLPGLTSDTRAAGDAAIYMGDHWASAASVIANAAKTIQSASQQLIAAGDAAHTAADQMKEFDAAMGDVGGGTLGQQLDRSMQFGQMPTIHANLQPGQQFQSPLWNPNVDPGGAGLSAGWGSGTFGPMFPFETQTFDPQDVAKALNTAATNLDTAGTALSDAAKAQQDAAWAAQDAAKMASVAAKSIDIVTNSLNSSALAAADAANQEAMNNAGFASVIANTNALMTGSLQAVAAATNTMIGAASVVNAVAAKAGVPGFTTFTPTGTTVSLPNVGPSGPGPSSTGGLPFEPPVFQSGPNQNVTVNVAGAPQFMQSLFTEFVRNLQTQGIRLTRG